jgi:hypothetical protein
MEHNEFLGNPFSTLGGIFLAVSFVALLYDQSVFTVRKRKKISYTFMVLSAAMFIISMSINDPSKFPTALFVFLCLIIPFMLILYLFDEHVLGMTAGERRKLRDWLQSWFYGDDK